MSARETSPFFCLGLRSQVQASYIFTQPGAEDANRQPQVQEKRPAGGLHDAVERDQKNLGERVPSHSVTLTGRPPFCADAQAASVSWITRSPQMAGT